DAITPEDGGKVTIGFRPESLDVVSAQDEHSIPVRLSFVEELGSDAYIYGELVGAEDSEAKLGSGEDSSQIIVRVPPRTAPEPGETVYVRIARPGAHLLRLHRQAPARLRMLSTTAPFPCPGAAPSSRSPRRGRVAPAGVIWRAGGWRRSLVGILDRERLPRGENRIVLDGFKGVGRYSHFERRRGPWPERIKTCPSP
ncbi:hypothetical protein HMPREF1129_0364, partial [Actinomyces naeslundii str. Howell 279]